MLGTPQDALLQGDHADDDNDDDDDDYGHDDDDVANKTRLSY